jgi:DNA-nicking Smr family endonuclease
VKARGSSASIPAAAEFELTDDGASFYALRAGLDRRLLRDLRAERWPPTARLDLHGMVAERAEEALSRFLAGRRNSGDRVVLVICGRGVHSSGGVGVLRSQIGAWLTRGPASEHVLCFSAARPERGGDGAIYVMLRSGG